MNIKKALKARPIIRKIGQAINTRMQFSDDAGDFNRYYVGEAEKKGDYRYSIMLLVHSLEKGMCFQNPRPFGSEKVKELISLLTLYSTNNQTSFEYKLGISALAAWKSFFEDHKWELERGYKDVKDFLEHKTLDSQIISGVKKYKPCIQPEDADAFENIVSSRHSVRDYKDKKIDPADVQYALKCFVETPTACNRQMCRVYYIDKPETRELLNSVLIGIPGFNKKTVQYFIITYDLAAFAYSGERQQGMFNAGLCAMSFMLGLHVKGIGSCCLQWSNKYKQDKEVRDRLGIRPSERIGIVIGAGYYLEENTIPCSVRRNPEEVFTIV